MLPPLNSLQLHRVGDIPDWKTVPPARHNGWQRLAIQTYGMLTPGNVISLIGLTFVMIGLWQIASAQLGQGAILVAIGRIADLVDGVVADHTGTKSPMGEILDASFDKLGAFVALYIFTIHHIVPVWLAVLFVLQLLITVLIALWARGRRVVLHPSKIGKFTTAASWLALLAFISGRYLTAAAQHASARIVLSSAYGLATIALALGIVGIHGYVVTFLGNLRNNQA